ncbi:Tyrosine-protein kinase YwqD [Stieleria maiorica]|uniref:Tyrosine-protein kinase YwqD n=1 Tax=Stieleria maiorica TaxID=2795974 RepID=A0A5B9MQL9_9BACT|nr:P-loop NTPase [Stieleria maiorica]QEG02541.1 Tyrosine-protein kinase YwqD [Stieleria maiorica]
MKTDQTFIGAYTRNRRRAGMQPTAASAPDATVDSTAGQVTEKRLDRMTEQVTEPVTEQPTEQVADRAHPSPPPSHLHPTPVDRAKVVEQLLGQSMTISDTFVELREVWSEQPAGQVLRIDRPVTTPVETKSAAPTQPVANTETITNADPPQPGTDVREMEAIADKIDELSVAIDALAEPPANAESNPAATKPTHQVQTPTPPAAPIESPAPVQTPAPVESDTAIESAAAIQIQASPAPQAAAQSRATVEPQATSPEPPAPRWAGATWEVDAFDLPSTVAELFFDEAFFRSIAEHLGQSVREGLRSVLVTSLSAGEGRSTVAIGTAIAAAATGIRVALIDIDLHTPSQADLLRLEVEADWVTAIRQGTRIEDAAIASIEDGVTLLPLVLSQHRGMPITATEIDRLLEQLDGCFDLLLFDGPVAAAWATPQIASAVDSSLIVRDARTTSKHAVATAAVKLRRQGVQGIGVVDNFCG